MSVMAVEISTTAKNFLEHPFTSLPLILHPFGRFRSQFFNLPLHQGIGDVSA
jgi:hypothetical protein